MSERAAQPEARPVGVGALFGRGLATALPAENSAEPAMFPPLPDLGDLMATEHARGFAEGEAATALRWQDQEKRLRAEAAAALDTAMQTSQAGQAALAAAYADSLADLLIAGLRTILETQPPLAPETVRSLIAEALSAAPAEGAGRFLVHPGMVEAARPFLPDGWRIAADPTTGWGSVRAEIDQTCLSASLDRRLQRLGRLLRGEENE